MNIIHVSRIIGIIENGMLPKTPLPNAAFMAFDSDLGAVFYFRECLRKGFFDSLPPIGILIVTGWQRSNGVHVIRQDNPRVDMKG